MADYDWCEENYISIKWHVNDVLEVAERLSIPLTLEDARDVLDRVKRNHDASCGVSWETLEFWIQELFG